MNERNRPWLWLLIVILSGFLLRTYRSHARHLASAVVSQGSLGLPRLAGLSPAVVAPPNMPPNMPPNTPSNTPTSAAKLVRARAENYETRSSLRAMAHVLATVFAAGRSQDSLWQALVRSGQDPFLAIDHQAHAGDLVFVRTNRPPPGTRYFHAQYFATAGQGEVLQHVSFELKPGPHAMDAATAEVKSAFPELGEPTARGPGFAQWRLSGEYVIWVKVLDRGEIENNPFNAYSPEDVGSVRVAIELE